MQPKLNFSRKFVGVTVRIAIVLLVLLGSLNLRPTSTAYAAASVTVNWTDVRQTIDGFGAAGAFQRATYLMNMTEPARSNILDALFSQTTGAGLSIVRNIVGDGSTLSDGVPTIEPSLNNWVWTGDEGQIWLMQQAQARGATRFMSTVWSPPAWMKTNNSIIQGSLATSHYQDYANYLSRYVREYNSRFGLPIYAISLANEPCISVSYSSTCWTGAQFRDFIKNNLTSTFQTDGVTAKVMIGERDSWTEDVAAESLADSAAAARVDIVGGHQYSGSIVPFSNSASHGKKVWETEVSYFSNNDSSITDGISWARRTHDFMANANANAYLYWWLVTEKTDGEGLVQINQSNNTFTLNKRLFTLGNYSRFVRPGYVRIGSTASPIGNVFTTAYKDPATGKFAIVVINDNSTAQTIDITPSGFSASSVTPYVTDSTRNLAQLAAVPLTGISLAARSVTTFVGTAGGSNPTATPTPTSTPTRTNTPTGPTNTPVPGTLSINTGGSATGSFTADQFFSGGNTFTNTNTIDLSQITSNPPPAAIFNSERYGAMTYTIPNLSGAQTVTLYFAETFVTAAGQRVFNVSINGTTVLSSFDIFASAGGQNRAIARTFNTTANGSGQVVIQFTTGTENPKINGITVASGGGGGPTLTPTPTPTRTNTPTGPTLTPTRTNTPTPSSGNFLTNADMEAGTTNWVVNGAGTLSSDTSQFHGGTHSVKTTGRTAAWNGIGQNVPVSNFVNGQSYTVSVWVRSQTGTPTAKATLRLTASTTTYVGLATTAINANGWTLLTGTVPVSWSGTLTGVLFYVETTAGTDNIYIDDANLH